MIKHTITFSCIRLFSILFLLACVYSSNAQTAPYNQAIGIKIPGGFSATYKKFIAPTKNVEAMATIWNKGFRISGLYEFNFYSFPTVENLSWFVGPGAHIGFWKDPNHLDYGSKFDFGIDGIIGLDYTLNDLPINMSLDWQPSITLVGSTGFSPVFGGFSIRYIF